VGFLRTRRTNALLAPLAEVVAGEVCDSAVRGTFQGYAVEGRARSGFPVMYSTGDGARHPADVNSFRLTLSGVAGREVWRCQSSPSSVAHDLASRFTAGSLLGRFRPGEFKFGGVDTLREAGEKTGEKLARRLGVPLARPTDPALQDKLVAFGLFEELDALRWGPHPFLPIAAFIPSGRDFADAYTRSPAFARIEPGVSERLRAAGLPDFESVIRERMDELAGAPGRLELEVETGKQRVPTSERFRELLDRAVRIAEINLRANPPEQPRDNG
jgi:hypothetical protein